MRSAFTSTYSIIVLTSAFLLLLSSCSSEDKGARDRNVSNTVMVTADVSLKPTLQEVAVNYSYVTNNRMEFNFVTASQLLDGSESDSADIYIFSNNYPVQEAREKGLVDSLGEITLAYAIPCLIVPRFNPYMITTLTDLKSNDLTIGLVDPSADNLGDFSLEILQKNNLYEKLKNRLVQVGPTAFELANRVSRAELDAAITWTVSANWNPESFEVVLFVPGEIPRVAAVTAVRAAKPIDSDNADRLMTYLNSDRCQHIFRKWGYLISDSDVDMYAPAAHIGGAPEYTLNEE